MNVSAGAPPREGSATSTRTGRRLAALVGGRQGVYLLLLAICVVGVVVSPEFLTLSNVITVLRSISIVGVIAVGMTFVTIAGSFVDLSVTSVLSASGVVVLAAHGLGLPVAVVLALAVGIAVGSFNGALVNWFGANPVLLTLATQTIGAGAILAATDAHYVYGKDQTLADFGDARLGPVPSTVLVFLLIALVAELLRRRTTWGRRLHAAGANPRTALLSGLRPGRVRAQAFLLSGLCAALAGVLLSSSLNAASPTAGVGYDFNAITAVVIGGASLAGGRGSIAGTAAGALLIGILNNLLVLNGAPFALQQVVTGLILALTVGVDVMTRREGHA